MDKKRYLVVVVFVITTVVFPEVHAFDDEKQGFVLGFGVGAFHLSRAHNDNTNNGLLTSFKLGYGFSNSFLLYYVNDIAWFKNDADNTVISGLTGIGLSYFIKEIDPSFYLALAYGLGSHYQPFETNTDPYRGTGFSIGVGYELASHLLIEAAYRKSSLERDGRPGFTFEPSVMSVLMSYYFY